MTNAHWIVLGFVIGGLLGQTIKLARDPDWQRRPGVMTVVVCIAIIANAVQLWALHAIGAFPWVAP